MPATETNPDLESLLDYLRRSRGFDFTGYKRSTLGRRIDRRMQSVGVDAYASYVDYLEVHPDEFDALFDTVLINVTCFFRDPEAWQQLAERVLPDLLGGKEPAAPVRVWSAGCASGEEAYTLAMVLAEAMGLSEFRERVKIYATDVDDDALARARQATYAGRELDGVPSDLLEKYFEESNGRHAFRSDLRRTLIFGRHDLTRDAPISRVDLLVCRNALMYFNAETQHQIITRFHFALNDGGVLFLGRAETMLTRTHLFEPVDLRRRLFRKLTLPGFRDRPPVRNGPPGVNRDERGVLDVGDGRLRDAVLDASPVAQIVVGTDGALALANASARTLFGLSPDDVGRPLQDLELSYRPVELRSRVDEVYATRRPVLLRSMAWQVRAGEARTFDVHFVPLGAEDGSVLGVAIAFADTTLAARLQRELEHANQELETAYEELQSTNEELETTNEELQSTVEELETTNEELQSTNEELETMNEELQSMNEELQTMNEELRRRSDEAGEVNLFLESILASLRGGVVVLDRELRVLLWNAQSEELWGLRADEVQGQHFFALDIGLPREALRQPLRRCLSGDSEVERFTADAVNRRGKPVQCTVTCAPLRAPGTEVRGAIVLVE
jgi:two-component system, chemotaxis family, CheB/CheR fusion protein